MLYRTLILTNGELVNGPALKARVEAWSPDLVIAADGGSRHASTLGLHIDLIVGDLDSIEDAQRESLRAQGTQFEHFKAEKDETDLELALLRAVEQGAAEIAVVGIVGDRLDMVLANIHLLTLEALSPIRAEIWLGRQTAWLIRPPGEEFEGAPGDTLSLIPLKGDAIGVTTNGLAYPLRRKTLFFGPARGVSNVMEREVCRVDLEAGILLAVHTQAA
ncbi:MAG: thiamine diphosphokinase [Anaerolineales bacterium]|nr:thiamine diphosphokinase [Anaerolineales bacterium]